MSILKQFKAFLTPTTPGVQYDENNPFVASEPWEWPDDDHKYGYDNIEDDDVVYDFEWAETNDGAEFVNCYRERVGKYTRFIAIAQEEDPDDTEPIRDSAIALEVIFFKDEQIHGEKREYCYDPQEDDESGSVTIDVESYANTFSMPRMAQDDLYMDFDQLEHLGDSVVEQRLD